jgi:hypothetical protein
LLGEEDEEVGAPGPGTALNVSSDFPLEISRECLHLGRVLGSGQYGEVFEATLTLNGHSRQVAAKVFRGNEKYRPYSIHFSICCCYD